MARVWRNPVNGDEAVYVASHAFTVSDMDEGEGQEFIDRLVERMTGPDTSIPIAGNRETSWCGMSVPLCTAVRPGL